MPLFLSRIEEKEKIDRLGSYLHATGKTWATQIAMYVCMYIYGEEKEKEKEKGYWKPGHKKARTEYEGYLWMMRKGKIRSLEKKGGYARICIYTQWGESKK